MKDSNDEQRIFAIGFRIPNEWNGRVRTMVIEYKGNIVKDDVDDIGREIEDWQDGPGSVTELGPWIWTGTAYAEDGGAPVYEGAWHRPTAQELARFANGEAVLT